MEMQTDFFHIPGSRPTPRDYQQETIDKSLDFMARDKMDNGIIIKPTGSGKSVVIAELATALEGRTIVFQPSKEILQQNYDKLIDYGYYPSVFSASMRRRETGKLTLATIGSVKDYSKQFEDVQNVLVDECHLVNAKQGMYLEFFDKLPNCRVLGLTATPFRLSNDAFGGPMMKFLTRTRPRIFSKVVHVVQTGPLFERGYLCPLEYREVDCIDTGKLALNSTGADYDETSVAEHYQEIDYNGKLENICKSLMREGKKHILVFTRFVANAEELARRTGFEVVTAKTPDKDRERVVKYFKAGKIRGVANVGTLTTGFDFPALDAIVAGRETRSLGLHYQMCGRGVRPSPGKTSCTFVDMAGLVKQFGKLEDLEFADEGNGKWFASAKGKKLTNVYLNGGDFHPLLPDLRWGPTENFLGSAIKKATPDALFWSEWRNNRAALLESGVSITKGPNGWVAHWKQKSKTDKASIFGKK